MSHRCPNACATYSDAPFFYPPQCIGPVCDLALDDDPNHNHAVECLPNLGVLVYPGLSITNRWCDGVVNVPDWTQKYLDEHDRLPCCHSCGEQVEHVH